MTVLRNVYRNQMLNLTPAATGDKLRSYLNPVTAGCYHLPANQEKIKQIFGGKAITALAGIEYGIRSQDLLLVEKNTDILERLGVSNTKNLIDYLENHWA